MARKQEHPIELSEVERAELEAIVRKGLQKARIIRRAQALLWSDTQTRLIYMGCLVSCLCNKSYKIL